MKAAGMASERGPVRAVLFDLDGTLVDSAPDIAASVNQLMAAYGLASHSPDAVRGMIGNGIERLVERAFAAHGLMLATRELDERRVRMTEIYGRNLIRLTTLRPGARQALAAAREAGAQIGVVTNKPQGFSRTILGHFGLLGQLRIVIGGDSGHAGKPAPDMLLAACEACRCSVGEAVLVGDSPVDAGAARAAGMTCIIVRGGYTGVAAERMGVDHVIDSLEDLEPILAAVRRAA
jgi:phosphoglycolate phosphatase